MRTLERLVLYVVVVIGGLSLLDRVGADEGQAAAEKEILRAFQVEITNEKGQVVLRLGAAKGGGGEITVLNQEGGTALRLHARTDQDGEVQLYDETSKLRAAFGGDREGGYANLYNRKGDLACYVGGDTGSERGYVALYGREKAKVLELIASTKGGGVRVRNGSGKTAVAMLGATDDTGAGFLAVGSPAGAPAVEISSTPKGGNVTVRSHESKSPVAILCAAPDTGTGYLGLRCEKGRSGVAMYTSQHGGQVNVLNTAGKKVAFLGTSAAPAGNGLAYVARDDGQRLFETGRNGHRGGYASIRNGLGKRVVFLGATTGEHPDDGVVEVTQKSGTLGVVLRGYGPQSSVRVYDREGKVKDSLR